MLILGIDPGYRNVGIAVIDHTFKIIESRQLKTLSDNVDGCLVEIFEAISDAVTKHKIDIAVIEEPAFTKFHQNANPVLQAMGVIKLAIELQKIPQVVVSPSTVKKTVTGKGTADKNDVIRAVTKFTGLELKAALNHQADAIAIAISHLL